MYREEKEQQRERGGRKGDLAAVAAKADVLLYVCIPLFTGGSVPGRFWGFEP